MTTEEHKIHNFLKATPDAFYSTREIIRRVAGKGASSESVEVAVINLNRMVRNGILERDSTGHYRIKQKQNIEAGGRRWVSPEIAKLLKQSDTDFSQAATIEIADPEEEL